MSKLRMRKYTCILAPYMFWFASIWNSIKSISLLLLLLINHHNEFYKNTFPNLSIININRYIYRYKTSLIIWKKNWFSNKMIIMIIITLSCRTNDVNLQCLKYFGKTFCANSSILQITSIVPCKVLFIIIAIKKSNDIQYLGLKKKIKSLMI